MTYRPEIIEGRSESYVEGFEIEPHVLKGKKDIHILIKHVSKGKKPEEALLTVSEAVVLIGQLSQAVHSAIDLSSEKGIEFE